MDKIIISVAGMATATRLKCSFMLDGYLLLPVKFLMVAESAVSLIHYCGQIVGHYFIFTINFANTKILHFKLITFFLIYL